MKLWGLFVAIFACLCGCMYAPEAPEGESPVELTTLDVGQGLAVLLKWNGRYALYDFGPDSVGVVDSLVAHGVDTLEWVVLSHFHRDHIGGFMELPGRGIFVRHLYVGTDMASSFFHDSVLRVASRLEIPVDTIWRGESAGLAAGLSGGTCTECPQFDVLWPTSYARVEGNASSVVLLVRYGTARAILTGDLDSTGERRVLEMNPTLSAELLQVGHHGSAGSNTLAFLSQVSPKYAFVSVGEGNGYGHPAPSVVRKLNIVLEDSTKLFRTDLQGSILFELSPSMGVIAASP